MRFQGLLTVDLRGAISGERSAVVDRWFGEPAPHATLAELVRPYSSEFAVWLELGLEALRDGLLPTALCIEQLPRRLAANGHAFDVAYSPIAGDAGVERILVIVSDVTEHLERERVEREQRELLAVSQRISTDRDACEELLRDASGMIAALGVPRDRMTEQRTLHTLKGNCAIFGLERYAELCHLIESELAEPDSGGVLTDDQRARLRDGWKTVTGMMSRLLGGRARNIAEIELPELVAVVDDARDGASGRELAPVLASWMHEPAWRRFDRLGRYAVGLARRLGRGEIGIAISDSGIRLDAARWAPLWSVLIHAVRNAVDHGFEWQPAPRPQVLSFAAVRTASQLTLSIADNGNGIHWEAVRARARRAGLPHATQKDLVEALFVDGISTRERVTEISGRGLGLAALRGTVIALGGTIDVESWPKTGTRFTFRFARGARAERRGAPSEPSRIHAS